MKFHEIGGFQSGLIGTEADRKRSHGAGGKQNEVYGTRGFQLRLFGTEADRMRSHETSDKRNEVL